MELRDLTHDEQLGLVALVEVVVSSDAAVSEDEESFVVNLAGSLGEDAYYALIDEADERCEESFGVGGNDEYEYEEGRG